MNKTKEPTDSSRGPQDENTVIIHRKPKVGNKGSELTILGRFEVGCAIRVSPPTSRGAKRGARLIQLTSLFGRQDAQVSANPRIAFRWEAL